jgi:hypothetical protein
MEERGFKGRESGFGGGEVSQEGGSRSSRALSLGRRHEGQRGAVFVGLRWSEGEERQSWAADLLASF